MVLKYTHLNLKTAWWRPLTVVLGLLLTIGISSPLAAQECGATINNNEIDGTTVVPDGSGTVVDFFDIEILLSGMLGTPGGDEILDVMDVDGFYSSSCSYNFYTAAQIAATNTANTMLIFDCDDLDNGTIGSYIFIRLDNNGSITSGDETFAVRIVAIKDSSPPILTAPGNQTVMCGNPTDLSTTTLGNPTGVMDNCSALADITITSVDNIDVAASNTATSTNGYGTRVINRTFLATDESNNTGTTVQVITVEDQQDPVFTDPDGSAVGSVTVSATASTTPIPASLPAVYQQGNSYYMYSDFPTVLECNTPLPTFTTTATDNCGTPTIVELAPFSQKSTNSSLNAFYQYSVYRVFRATDELGNVSIATREYQYNDTTAPVFTSVQATLGTPTRVGTTNEFTAAGMITLSSNPSTCKASLVYSPAATDNCAPANRISYSYEVRVAPSGSLVGFGQFNSGNFTVGNLNSGTNYTIKIIAMDVLGNTSFVNTDVEVLSAIPLITCTTSTIQVTLNSVGTGSINAQQILGQVPDQPCGPANPGTATPNAFNTLSYEIRDVVDGPVNTTNGTASGSGSSTQLSSAASGAFVNFDCTDAGSTRSIEVKVSNGNGGTITCTRQVQVVAGGTQTISASATPLGASAPGVADGKITVTTGGSSGPFTFTVSGGPTATTQMGGSPYTITGLAPGTYTVNISTNNGCSTTTLTNIFVPVDDPISLTAVCPTAFTSGTVDIPIRVADFDNINSTEFSVTVTGLTILSSSASNLPDNPVTNQISSTQLTFSWFQQNMNNVPPVTLANGTTILTIQAQVPNTAGSYSVAINGVPTALSATQNQGSGSAASTPVTVNTTGCSGTIQSSPASVNGTINFFSTTGNGVNDVTLALTSGNTTTTTLTNATGAYNISAMPNSNITLTPSRPHNNDQAQLLEGINGGDLVQIQRHLLFLSNTLNTPYKLIAADANGSNQIEGGDLVVIQRAILNLETSFPVPSWRFVRAAQPLTTSNVFTTNLQESYTANNLNTAVQENFVAIKVGDVDCSATAPYETLGADNDEKVQSGEVDSRNALPISVKERKLKKGGVYEVNFTARDFRDLLAYQTTIEFDTDALSFVDVETAGELGNLNEDNFGLRYAAEGMITTLWYSGTEQSLADGAEVFTLRFEALQDGVLSRALRFTSNGIPQMAMGKNFAKYGVELNFENQIQPANKFDVIRNQPNPFSDFTTIIFELAENDAAVLNVMDVNGRIVKSYQDFASGYNEVEVSRTDLPAAGIYFYQLVNGEQSGAVQRMIVTD